MIVSTLYGHRNPKLELEKGHKNMNNDKTGAVL
jgi:hypothetical protein